MTYVVVGDGGTRRHVAGKDLQPLCRTFKGKAHPPRRGESTLPICHRCKIFAAS